MKNKCILLALLLSGMLIFSSCCKKTAPQQEKSQGVWDKNYLDTTDFNIVTSVNGFGFNLYARLNPDENLIFSPLSISSALAMTYAGAENNTQQQMAGVLGFVFDKKQVNEGFSALMNEMNVSSESYRISLANSLWAQEQFYFKPEFLENMKKNYHSGFQFVNFINRPDEAREKINQWVSEKTEDKIKDILSEKDINAATRLILVNAIYFNATWATVFDEKQTRPGDFFLIDGQKITVDMMQEHTGKYRYFENDKLQFLSMDYAGKLYSMNILLPKSPDKLPALEKAFNPGYFSELENMSKWQGVDVYLPRFTFSSSFSLKAILSAAGMSDAFDDNADFSGMTGKKNLMIDNILHKAFIEVNEKGTEAAASTAVVMMERAALPEEKSEFKADHPFFFYIKNNESGAIMFMGKVMNPKQ